MQLKVKRNINKAVVEIEIDDKDDKVAIGKAITLSVEDYCDNCQSREGIIWKQNKAETEKGTFLYIKRRCLKCGAESTLGEYSGNMGYFWKPFEKWDKGQTSQPETASPYDDPQALPEF